MEHMPTQNLATDPELDQALIRAIRRLIFEAIDAGAGAGAPDGVAA
jgi:hypothetical protein